jgi:VanZ family protein
MFVYGVLYLLLYRGINLQRGPKEKNWSVPFVLCLCYALLDEVHQSFTPNRSPTLRDVGFDMLGSGIAFLKLYDYI